MWSMKAVVFVVQQVLYKLSPRFKYQITADVSKILKGVQCIFIFNVPSENVFTFVRTTEKKFPTLLDMKKI